MPNPLIQAIIQGAPVQVGLEGAPIRIEMKAPQGPAGAAGPNTVTSATTTNFPAGNVLSSNGTTVTSLSRSGIDTRTSFPNTDVTAASADLTINAIVKRDNNGGFDAEFVDRVLSFGIGGQLYMGLGGLLTFATGSNLYITDGAAFSIEPTAQSDFRAALGLDDMALLPNDGTATIDVLNATVQGTLTANHIHGNIAGTVYTHVRTGEAMSKGDPFYIDGFHSGYPRVMKADASDPLKMPAVGVMDADYPANTNGANGIIIGTLTNVDTDGFGVNTAVYVADGGGYSTSAGTIPQQIGITERDNENNGAFIVTNSKVLTTADIANLANGTASLSVVSVTASDYIATVGDNAGIATSGNTAYISTTGESAYIYTTGESASIYTGGQFAYIYTTGLNASMFTSGDNASIYTSGSNAGIYTNGLDAPIYTLGGNAHISTQSATAYIETRSTFRLFDGTYATTLSHNPTADNAIAFQDGSGTVAFTSDLPTLGANVATFLATPTSANLAAAVTDKTGSSSLVFGTLPTLTSPTLAGTPNFTATSYTFATDARIGFLNNLSSQFVYKNGTIPFAEIFEDFPITGGTHGFITASGTTAYYTGGSSSSARYWGAISMTTGSVTDNTATITLAPSGGANGQTTSRIELSHQICFCVNNATSTEFRARFQGGGQTFDCAVLFSTGVVQLEAANIGGTGVNTVSVATGLSLAAGDFISGTRYRLFVRCVTATETEVYLASAPWNSSTWTTLVDTIKTHSAPTVAFVSTQPVYFVTTKTNAARIAYVDWVAIRYALQR